MCGIFGFYERRRPPTERTELAQRLANRMTSRGPDHGAAWSDDHGLTLAHRRLSIVDLTESAHQPMRSSSGRYVITFNGEIYNFRELRAQLEKAGRTFASASDTAVILEAIEAWGVPAAVRRLVGMFAFGLWDAQCRKLYLVRDRFGEKPLYYGWNRGVFFFASELKPIVAHPSWSGKIDPLALQRYFQLGGVPAPLCIYEGLKKLSPGHITAVSFPKQGEPSVAEPPRPYWDFVEMVAAREPDRRRRLSEAEAVVGVEQHLSRAVRRQMVADVPIGAFLSGGIDSSTVVALMQAQSPGRVRTFTIGFEEQEYDESKFAKSIARHLGTDHTELIVTIDRARDLVPRLPSIYDEPFADSSQLPTTLVAQLAREHVTVSLSGDGADELFGGYARYSWAERIWQGRSALPSFLRSTLGDGLRSVPVEAWQRSYDTFVRALPGSPRIRGFGQKVHAAGKWLSARSQVDLYSSFLVHWQDEVIRDASPRHIAGLVPRRLSALNLTFRELMMATDSLLYLPDDILTKVDRATMAASLESRAPFLDHELAEYVWGLPARIRFSRKTPKVLLARTLSKYVPTHLFDRPKAGFGVPIGRWLRAELRPWAEHLLNDVMVKRCAYLDHALVWTRWKEHVDGKRDWHGILWDLFMFLAWLDTQAALALGSYSVHEHENDGPSSFVVGSSG